MFLRRCLSSSQLKWLDSNGSMRFFRSAELREKIMGSSVSEPFLADLARFITTKKELEQSLKDPSLMDLSQLVREEIIEVEEEIEKISEQIRTLVLLAMEKDGRMEEDALGARLEVRAGVGGVEAGMWAEELFHMYLAAADRMGWTATVESSERVGGIPGADTVFQAQILGNAYGWLKFEAGVHRVQRVPSNSDRMQTSAAAVWVMPKVSIPEVVLRDSDLKITISKKSSGAGGQSVNAAYQQVRMVHQPTGYGVTVSDSSAQQENKEIAYARILSHLTKLAEDSVLGQLTRNRKTQIKTADRSEKIRTYNFQRNEINDHRIPKFVIREECTLFLHQGNLMPLWTPLREENENQRINEFICQKP